MGILAQERPRHAGCILAYKQLAKRNTRHARFGAPSHMPAVIDVSCARSAGVVSRLADNGAQQHSFVANRSSSDCIARCHSSTHFICFLLTQTVDQSNSAADDEQKSHSNSSPSLQVLLEPPD